MKQDVKQQAVSLLREYYEKSEQAVKTDGFFSEFLNFMNSGLERFDTNMYSYQCCIENVFTALTNPNVSTPLFKALETDYSLFIDILIRLQRFLNKIEMHDHYQALLYSYFYELYASAKDDKENIEQEIQETELKLAALRARHPERKI